MSQTNNGAPGGTDGAEITPDDKDWTWVLQNTCDECGFDVRGFDRTTTGDLIRNNAAQWQSILNSPNTTVRPSAAV